MILQIHEDVQELIDELNEIGTSQIFGGYIRDMIVGNTPSDVDIVTNIPVEVLEQKYCNLEKAKRRVTASGHNVYSFKLHRREKIFVEIISTDMNLLDKPKQADYTINSLLYDGNQVIDLENGLEDIKDRIIREVDGDIIKNDLNVRPYLWLKTLRLVSMLGYNLSQNTFNILKEGKECIKEISPEIMQSEGYKTMNGKDPIKALKLLACMGFIHPFESDKFLGNISIQPHQKLCVLAVLTSKQTIDDFVKLYCFQQPLIEKYNHLYEMYFSKEKIPNRFRHQVITMKKIVQKE